MKLRSSANIEIFSYQLLLRSCKVKKITLSKMISRILKEAFLKFDIKKEVILCHTVKYQPKGLKYMNVHFYLEGEEYESCIDFRKFGKVSVSSVLNAWIKKLLRDDKKYKSVDGFSKFRMKLDNYVVKYNVIVNEYDKNNKILIKIERKFIFERQIQ